MKDIISFQGLIKVSLSTCCVNLKRCTVVSMNLTKCMTCNIINNMVEALYWLKIAQQLRTTVGIHKDMSVNGRLWQVRTTELTGAGTLKREIYHLNSRERQ